MWALQEELIHIVIKEELNEIKFFMLGDLLEVVCKDEHGRLTTTTTKDDLFWDSVKKWRYAKEKKAK